MFKTNFKHFRFEKKDIGLWLVLTLPITFYQTSLSFIQRWSENEATTYSHGWLLSLIALGILINDYYMNRDRFKFNTSCIYLILLIIILIFWLLATISFTQVAAQILMIGLMTVLFCYFYGLPAISYIYITASLLLTVTSIWDVLNTPLREIAAFTSSILLNVTGFTNFRDGFFIHIPVGIFHVDTGCSGLSQFVVALAIGLIYAWHANLKITRTVLATLMIMIAAVIANIIRIYIIIALGQLTNMQHYFVAVEHRSLGWIVFAVLIYFFFVIATRSLESNPSTSTIEIPKNNVAEKIKPAIFIPTVLCICTSVYASTILIPEKNLDIPIQINNSWDVQSHIPASKPSVSGASQELHRTINYQNSNIDMHIYFFNQQTQNNEAVNNNNKVSSISTKIKKINEKNKVYNKYLFTNKTNDKYISAQIYWVKNKFYKWPLYAKLASSLNTILGNKHTAYIAIGSEYRNIENLETFMEREIQNLNFLLQQHSLRSKH